MVGRSIESLLVFEGEDVLPSSDLLLLPLPTTLTHEGFSGYLRFRQSDKEPLEVFVKIREAVTESGQVSIWHIDNRTKKNAVLELDAMARFNVLMFR